MASNLVFSDEMSRADFFVITNSEISGLNNARDLPAYRSLLTLVTMDFARNLSRSDGFMFPVISIDC